MLDRANQTPVLTGPVAWEPNTGEAHAVVPGSTTIWRHDAGRWQPVITATAAPALVDPQVCTWPGHGVLLTAGGQTWLFDGTDWSQIVTPTAVPAGVRTLMFDPLRNVAVAVLGALNTPTLVWEFDGTTWQQRFPTTIVYSATWLVSAWDKALQRGVVRFGVPGTSGFVAWDGNDWAHLSTGAPGAPGLSMATDPVGGVVVSGGYNSYTSSALPTIHWTSTGFTFIETSTGPPRRSTSVAWYDPVRDLTVVSNLLAGNRGTWYWNGTVWSQPPDGVQMPHGTAPLAYDSWRGVVLGHGGESIWGYPVDGLWQLQALEAQYRGPGPWARFAHALAFDSWRGRLVLFGGGRPDSFGSGWLPVLDGGHTFEWDGATWHTIPATTWTPATDPRFRVNAAMAFDRARGKTVLFGGAPVPTPQSTLAPRDDTFEWDGSIWVRMQPGTVPPALAAPRLEFDPDLGKCVLWGNGSAWSWDGTDWMLLPFPSPPGEPHYDVARGRWVAFGTTQTRELTGGAWQPVSFAGTAGPMAFDLGLGAFAGNDELGAFTWGDPAAASLRPFGNGCAGSAGVPVLHSEDAPRLGQKVTLHVAHAPAGAPIVALLGAEATSWLGAPLPIALGAIGMPGCSLDTPIDVDVLIAGTALPIVIPSTASLIGNAYRCQVVVVDLAANALGLITSNALAIRIGA